MDHGNDINDEVTFKQIPDYVFTSVLTRALHANVSLLEEMIIAGVAKHSPEKLAELEMQISALLLLIREINKVAV